MNVYMINKFFITYLIKTNIENNLLFVTLKHVIFNTLAIRLFLKAELGHNKVVKN